MCVMYKKVYVCVGVYPFTLPLNVCVGFSYDTVSLFLGYIYSYEIYLKVITSLSLSLYIYIYKCVYKCAYEHTTEVLQTNCALWYPVGYKMKTNERYYLIPYNSLANVIRFLV